MSAMSCDPSLFAASSGLAPGSNRDDALSAAIQQSNDELSRILHMQAQFAQNRLQMAAFGQGNTQQFELAMAMMSPLGLLSTGSPLMAPNDDLLLTPLLSPCMTPTGAFENLSLHVDLQPLSSPALHPHLDPSTYTFSNLNQALDYGMGDQSAPSPHMEPINPSLLMSDTSSISTSTRKSSRSAPYSRKSSFGLNLSMSVIGKGTRSSRSPTVENVGAITPPLSNTTSFNNSLNHGSLISPVLLPQGSSPSASPRDASRQSQIQPMTPSQLLTQDQNHNQANHVTQSKTRPRSRDLTSTPTEEIHQDADFKRNFHKEAEQRRRDSLKSGFDEMRRLLPRKCLPEGDRTSKIIVMHEAVQYVARLQQREMRQAAEITKLQLRLRQYESVEDVYNMEDEDALINEEGSNENNVRL